MGETKELSYSNAVTALIAIQDMSENANPPNVETFNFASALLNLTVAVSEDLAAIRQEIQELQQLVRGSQHP